MTFSKYRTQTRILGPWKKVLLKKMDLKEKEEPKRYKMFTPKKNGLLKKKPQLILISNNIWHLSLF